jgi:hypothetical protein
MPGRFRGQRAHPPYSTVCRDGELIVQLGFLQEEGGRSCGSDVRKKRLVEGKRKLTVKLRTSGTVAAGKYLTGTTQR